MSVDKKKNKTLFEETGKKIITLYDKREDTISSEELDTQWKEIKRKAFLPVNKKNNWRIILSTAALLSGLLLGTYFLYSISDHSIDEMQASILDEPVNYDVADVTLITETENVILENDADVKYSEEGNIIVNRENVAKIKDIDSAKKSKHNQIIVPNGKRTRLTLIDGTFLYINSGSRVVYPSVFEDDKREIFVDGEVYLEVAFNSECPFIVKTEQFDIKVLGTSFNVTAYKEDRDASVVLVEGAVEMVNRNKETVKLKPGERLTVNSEGTSLASVDVNEFILWKDNILYLGNYKYCDEILNRLSRYYGIKIKYDETIRNIPLGGKLDICENIDDVLEILSISMGITYHKETDGIISIKLE